MIQAFSPFRLFSVCFVFIIASYCGSIKQANAQSQALNGQIEGVVTDATGAAVPNASLYDQKYRNRN